LDDPIAAAEKPPITMPPVMGLDIVEVAPYRRIDLALEACVGTTG
jgi:hypothetical protein